MSEHGEFMQVSIKGDSTLLDGYDNPNGLASIRVFTESAPGRPFPAWEVVAEVYAVGDGKPTLRPSDRARELVNVLEEQA